MMVFVGKKYEVHINILTYSQHLQKYIYKLLNVKAVDVQFGELERQMKYIFAHLMTGSA